MSERFHDLREEVLERIWNVAESEPASAEAIVEQIGAIAAREKVLLQIEHLATDGLIARDHGRLTLTAAGRDTARHVVRAHRLAARFLTDVLEIPAGAIEGHACRLEHAIAPELADSLCTLLGHPPASPDGRPIPRGGCCSRMQREAAAAVFPLTSLPLGAPARIVYLHSSRPGRLDQLAVLGLVPGTGIRLRQTRPAVVLEVGETTVAMDEEVARDVYVKRARA
ncbi:MAG: metal-dependent transcriptional regulator [Acidobacteriota bacterium]